MAPLPEQQARQTIDAMLAASLAVWRTKTDSSRNEQTQFVAEPERRLSVVEELGAVGNTNSQRANRLRQSILQKAFTGELTS